MRLRKAWPFLIILIVVSAATAFLVFRTGDGNGTGSGSGTGTSTVDDGQLDSGLLKVLDLVNESLIKKPRPGPGIRMSGEWLDGIVSYEVDNPGTLGKFILDQRTDIGAKDVALQAYMRYIARRPQLAAEILDTAEAILDYETSDLRFNNLRLTAVGMIARAARLRKANPEMYRRSLDILLERLDSVRDIQILNKILAALTSYSEPEIIVPRLVERFDSIDLSDAFYLQVACQIVRSVGSIWSTKSDEFVKRLSREHPDSSVRITAVEVFRNRTSEFAVPFLEELQKNEKDTRVSKKIEEILAIKRRGYSPKR